MTISPSLRAQRSVALLALTAVLGLTACAPAAVESGSASGVDLLPPAEGATRYPLTLETAVGEIVINERPQRIVMGSSWDGDLFAALGVTPIATDHQISFFPWTTDRFEGEIETIWQVGDEAYPAETIAATTPQLIVDTLATDAVSVEKIGSIAPVLGAPVEESSWQERILLLGEALDLSQRAQSVIDDYETTFENIRTEHPEFAGTTVDYVTFYGADSGSALNNYAGSDAEALFTNLGFDENVDSPEFADGISDELWGDLTGDVLIISNQDAAGFEEFFANPLLQGLESVKAGRVIVLDLDTTTWTVSHNGELTDFTGHFGRAFNYGPLAHLELAELVTPMLSDALNQG